MVSKSDMVRSFVDKGDYKSALRIAKEFKLGIAECDSDSMKRGYECMIHPRFYKSIGMDTESIAEKGVQTVIRLFGT